MKIPHLLKPSRKRIIILIVLIVLGLIGYNLFAPKEAAVLQFTTVKKQDIKSTIASSGNLTGKDSASLKFKSSGKLSYINVKTGDKVQKWDVIAGLDTQDLNITLQQAQNTLRDKQAIIDKTLDDVKDHSKDETFTQRQTRTTAEVARDNAYDNVKAAQRAFQDAVIVSPLNGTITQAAFIPGQSVSASDIIAQVVDTSEIFFDVEVDEADISKISLGQAAEVSLDAYENQVFTGIIDQITPQTKTTSSGATVIPVRIKMDSPKIIFVNGLSGQASIITALSKNALVIPQEALREDNMVFVEQDKETKPVKVIPGIQSDTDVEIKDGLSEGQRVLLNPPKTGSVVNKPNRNPLQRLIRGFGGPTIRNEDR